MTQRGRAASKTNTELHHGDTEARRGDGPGTKVNAKGSKDAKKELFKRLVPFESSATFALKIFVACANSDR